MYFLRKPYSWIAILFLVLETGCMPYYTFWKPIIAYGVGKVGRQSIGPDEQVTEVLLIQKTSRVPVAIARKTSITPAGYIYPTDIEYVGSGTVLELFGIKTIEQQPYHRVRATYWSEGSTTIITGLISKANIQQLLITRDLEKILLTEGCPVECIAKNNASTP